MAKILPFPINKRGRFGFKRVRKKNKSGSGQSDQLDLFSPAGKIIPLPIDRSLFDAALFLDDQDREEAAGLYQRAIEAGECVADAYCNLGIIESRQGNTAQAFDCFTHSLRNDPRHFESHYNLGNLYFDNDNLKLARLHYELGSAIKPGYAHLFFNLGLVCALCQDYPAAITALQRYKHLIAREDKGADELLESLKAVAES